MAGDDERPLAINRVEDAGDEVGQALAHASARLEKERLVRLQRHGDRTRHGSLLGAMIQRELTLQVAAFLEDTFDQSDEVASRLGRITGAFNKTDHVDTLADASAQRMPSSAALTMPPAKPAPSPQG